MLTRMFPAVLPTLGREVDSMFRDMFSELPPFRITQEWGPHTPPMNILESREAYLVEIEIPGLKRDEIEVDLSNNVLTVQGNRRAVDLAEGASWQRRERFEGEFQRKVGFPLSVDASRVEAKLADGVLSIHVPKSAAALGRRIEVVEQRAIETNKKNEKE